jgi:hypothetical protein
MVRRDEAGRFTSASRCSSPAGASPASVSAGAPSSRPQVRTERYVAQAGCQEPLRREPVRGPQHHVKLAASSNSQSERRAGHVAAKTTPVAPQSGDIRARGLGGVWSAARGHGDERNTRGPSARPGSGQRDSYKPTAKSGRAQRESEGVVVLWTAAANNAVRGKDPCFGRARNEGKCEGMADTIGPNHPAAHERSVKARRPLHALGTSAERSPGLRRIDNQPRSDTRGAVRFGWLWSTVHVSSGRPSVSRVPEIGTHGLKGGPALSPLMYFTV